VGKKLIVVVPKPSITESHTSEYEETMTTPAINAKIDAISALAQQMFGEGELLDQFRLRLTAEIFTKQPTTKTTDTFGKIKKSSNKKSSDPQNRCGAYIFAIVKNDETGEFEPKQCSLSHEEGAQFCKKHGSVHGKRDEAASNYHGTEVFYEHKWQLCGSVESGPTFVFEKYKDQLMAKFNQASGSEASGNESDDSAPKKKVTAVKKEKTAAPKKEKKSKTEKAPATKRPKNPYFEYLSSERANIKADLLAENSELKGRDLVTSITKEAGRRWKEMSDEEKQPYIDVVSVNADAEETGSEIQQEGNATNTMASIEPCCDDHAHSHEEEEEENDRIFNESLNVWIDNETQLYYETEDSENPLGQVVRGKTVPFKTKKTAQ
jgi:hypothetical protein